MYVPDSVVELGEECFSGCEDLQSVTFGASSRLRRIGRGAFQGTKVKIGDLPEHVRRKYSSRGCTVA